MLMIFEITCCFWLIVFPFMVIDSRKDEESAKRNMTDEYQRKRLKRIIGTFIGIGVAHSLPFLAVIIDFYHSSVYFYLRHFILIFLFAILYCVFLFII